MGTWVCVTSRSRSARANVRVSIRCEMLAMARRSSLRRLGPSPASPRRARSTFWPPVQDFADGRALGTCRLLVRRPMCVSSLALKRLEAGRLARRPRGEWWGQGRNHVSASRAPYLSGLGHAWKSAANRISDQAKTPPSGKASPERQEPTALEPKFMAKAVDFWETDLLAHARAPPCGRLDRIRRRIEARPEALLSTKKAPVSVRMFARELSAEHRMPNKRKTYSTAW